MSDMRETLTEIIGTHVEFCGADAAADAIIAALPDMMKPLEWIDWSRPDGGELRCEVMYGAEYYLMDYEDGTWGWFTSFDAGRGYSGCQGKGLSLEAAKAAAQAHHTAAILSSLGLTK